LLGLTRTLPVLQQIIRGDGMDSKSYSEVLEHVYGGDVTEVKDRVSGLPDGHRQAFEILNSVLGRRNGFDYWWRSINEEYRDEIFNEVAKVLLGHTK
jgi:hypothetical protein